MKYTLAMLVSIFVSIFVGMYIQNQIDHKADKPEAVKIPAVTSEDKSFSIDNQDYTALRLQTKIGGEACWIHIQGTYSSFGVSCAFYEGIGK